jgi:hypothetical protein
VRSIIFPLLCFGLACAVAAQEPSAADIEHDPADPLLSELLAWDEFSQCRGELIRNCSPRIARNQWRNFRLRYERREQRIFSVVRERFGDRVIHGHDMILIGRCSRTNDGAFPFGIDQYRRALIAYEQHLGIGPRTAAQN